MDNLKLNLPTIFFSVAALLIFCVAVLTNENLGIVSKPEGLTAIFTGLGFLAMLLAVVMQGNILHQQKSDSAKQLVEMRRTAEANNEANKLAQRNLRAQALIFGLKFFEQEHREKEKVRSKYHELITILEIKYRINTLEKFMSSGLQGIEGLTPINANKEQGTGCPIRSFSAGEACLALEAKEYCEDYLRRLEEVGQLTRLEEVATPPETSSDKPIDS